jgi:hypothetical protein
MQECSKVFISTVAQILWGASLVGFTGVDDKPDSRFHQSKL